MYVSFFFFFQAEDGIRDKLVTGVQTCALPISQRRRYATNHLASAGLLLSSNAPVFNLAAGRIPRNVPLSITAPVGEVWYTTNGVDPRVPFTGAIDDSAQKYTGPIPLNQSTHVKARTFWSGNVSAVTEATFIAEQLGVPIRITEIMYNPPGGDAYEFIEIQNVGPNPIDLGGFWFEGVTFQFPKSEPPIMPGARWVIASDFNLAAFAQRYPQVQIVDAFSGTLRDGGETLILRDEAGNVVTMVEYDDENGWATAADGSGQSLELIDAHGEAGAVSNWKASGTSGGSPGNANSSVST